MMEDSEGFYYPVIDENNCINCGVCLKVCPIDKKRCVGDMALAYVCQSKEESVWGVSSSAGVFSLIAEQIIKMDGVVFGAAFSEEFNVHHIFVEHKDDIDKLRRSKYIQSAIEDSYSKAKLFLDEGRCVLFSGTAFQIARLQQYLGKEYEKLFTQDLVCYGVPSPGFWRAYSRKSKEQHQIKDILFRDKSLGWFSEKVSAVYDNGEKVIDDGQYLSAFLKGMLMRESCYQCQYKGYERESALILSDCWGWSRIAPQYNPRNGISSVLIHSAKGKELFDMISDRLTYTEVSPEIAMLDNEAAVKSSIRSPKREFILEQYQNSNIDELLSAALRDPLYQRIALMFLNENQKQKIHRLLKRIRKR